MKLPKWLANWWNSTYGDVPEVVHHRHPLATIAAEPDLVDIPQPKKRASRAKPAAKKPPAKPAAKRARPKR